MLFDEAQGGELVDECAVEAWLGVVVDVLLEVEVVLLGVLCLGDELAVDCVADQADSGLDFAALVSTRSTRCSTRGATRPLRWMSI